MTGPELLGVLVQGLLSMRAEPVRTRARRGLGLACAVEAYERMALLPAGPNPARSPDSPPNLALLELALAALSEIDQRGHDALLLLANHAVNRTTINDARRQRRHRGEQG